MNSSNEQSVKHLQTLSDELCTTIPEETVDEITSLLSAAYTAAQAEDPKIIQASLGLMKNSFAKLFQQIEEGTFEPFEDPALLWMEEHVDLIQPYRGKTVAIDRTVDQIVASGENFDDVWDQVEKLDPAVQERVVIDHVPDQAWL